MQERQRATLSRESTDRQGRIDRLQKNVQELQSKKPEGLRAQRAQQRLLETQNRRLQDEQRTLRPASSEWGRAASAAKIAAPGAKRVVRELTD